MSESEKKGYHLVCPDFGPDGSKLSFDAQVRCLSYVIGHLGEIAHVPLGVNFEVIPLRWHHFGDPYPSIGMTADPEAESLQDMTTLSFTLGDQMTEFIERVGLDKLEQLSSGETLTWNDVLRPHIE